jgi:predicted signal transduction protein with EAL and GGDEF domain
MKNADHALYAAKRAGKNAFRIAQQPALSEVARYERTASDADDEPNLSRNRPPLSTDVPAFRRG